MRDVVITGMGIISPVGNCVSDAWQALLSGQSGAGPITRFDASQYRTRIVANVHDFDVSPWMSAKEARRFDEFIHYAMAAGGEAMQQAGLSDDVLSGLDRTRLGVLAGSGIGGVGMIEQGALSLAGGGRLSPFFVPGSIINLAAGMLAIRYGLQGPNIATATACTTSAHAIGLAARLIAYGDADLMLCGGSERASSPLGIQGFSAMQALSTRNDAPQQASRPFDQDRDGFVLGDGAGMLVLESREHAERRGATIFAQLTGFGMSDDASHITAPAEAGIGAQLAMRHALRDAGLAPEAIDYINAHGTSTPAGDAAESQAIEAVFGEHAFRLAVSSTKSMTGHLLGAAGAVEAVFCVQSLLNQCVAPTINLDNPDPACRLDYVPHRPRQMPLKAVMSNSFGFGGTNGCLIFEAA